MVNSVRLDDWIAEIAIITSYRPLTKFRVGNVFVFAHVCLSGGGGLCDGSVHAGSMHTRGRGMHGRWSLKRAIRILLECILAMSMCMI